MTLEQMRAALDQCFFPEYNFHVEVDRRGAIYLQAHYVEPDTETGEPETQLTRRWFLSPEMTKSEIVATAFKCVLTSMEHRTREWFRYQGRAIYGPHYDVDGLKDLCDARRLAYREERQKIFTENKMGVV